MEFRRWVLVGPYLPWVGKLSNLILTTLAETVEPNDPEKPSGGEFPILMESGGRFLVGNYRQ